MDTVTFRTAEPGDLPGLVKALAHLARDLGDPYRAPDGILAQALFDPCPAASARLAEHGTELSGVTLFSPVFSTAQGGPGVYVSDLWVAPDARGQRLGRRLLADTAQQAATLWGAEFMRLSVHDDNDRAASFYRKLGFARAGVQSTLVLTGPHFQALGEPDESHS